MDGLAKKILLPILLSAAVLVSFSPSLKAGFLNWDDDINILENLSVRSLELSNLKHIFTESVQGIYIPLTTLSYALEYHWAGYAPFVYHLNNLILHTLNTLLVFLIALRFGLLTAGALTTALLFGIHPMKAESVMWVTERKDVLYAFFYLIAVLNYKEYLRNQSRGHYAWAVAAGFLSILSKPMALSLPLILFLIDWFHKRPFKKTMLLDKLPFLITIIPIALITYLQHVRNPVGNMGEAILIWIWTFVFYILKFVFPFVLIPLYRLPQPVVISAGPFAGAVAIFILLIISVLYFRRYRWWTFAIGYYVLSIFFLLRFDVGTDLNVVADRFMYLPCLGFCLAAGYGLDKMMSGQNRGVWRSVLIGTVLVTLSILLMTKTLMQSNVWKDPMTLWTYVIEKDPASHVGYNNRGNIYNEKDKLNDAMADYNRALTINPKFARAYNNRGIVFAKAGRNDEAMIDFNKAVEFKPDFEKAYYNRSVILERLGYYSEALQDAYKAKALGVAVPVKYLNDLELKAKASLK